MNQFNEYESINNPIPAESGDGVTVNTPVVKTPKLSAADKFAASLNSSTTEGSVAGRHANTVQDADRGSTLNANIDEQRAQRQSGFEQAWHGTAKGAGLAATTFLSTFTSLPYGIVSAAGKGLTGHGAQESFSAVYDNEISRKFDEFNKNMEEWFPNYYTEEQKKADAFSWTNMGNANFIFDKLVKNAGFTVGAIVGGGVVSKGLHALGKLAMGANYAREMEAVAALTKQGMGMDQAIKQVASGIRTMNAANQVGATLIAAANEGSVEALQTKNDIKDKLTKEYESKGVLTAQDYQEIEDTASAAANSVFAANMAILGISDTIQFAKFLGGGYKQEAKAMAKLMKEDGKWVAKASGKFDTALNVAKATGTGMVTEAGEEGAQFTSQKAAEDYTARKYHQPSIGKFQNLVHSVAKGFDETIGTKEGIESMLLGAITGIGSHVVTGQIIDDLREPGLKQERAKKAAQLLNDYKATSIFSARLDATIRANSIMDSMNEAVVQQDVFRFKNLEHDLFKNFVQSRIETNKFDLLIEELNELKQLPKDEFLKLFGLDQSNSTQKSVSAYVDQLTTQATRMAKSWEDVQTRFPSASPELKENLWSSLTNIQNRDQREAELSLEVYSALGVSLNDEKLKDDKGYLKTFKDKVDAKLAERPDLATTNVEKVDDLVKVVEDRHDLIEDYRKLLTPEGQAAQEAKTRKSKLKAALETITQPDRREEATTPLPVSTSTTPTTGITPEEQAAAQGQMNMYMTALEGATAQEKIDALNEVLKTPLMPGLKELVEQKVGELAIAPVTTPGAEATVTTVADKAKTIENIKKSLLGLRKEKTDEDIHEMIEESLAGAMSSQDVVAQEIYLDILDWFEAFMKRMEEKRAADAAKPVVTGLQTEDVEEFLESEEEGDLPPVSEVPEHHLSGSEFPNLAATLWRSTGNHELALANSVNSINRYQMFIQDHLRNTPGVRVQLVTPKSDLVLYKALLNKDQRAWHAAKDPEFKTAGIITVLVDAKGDFLIALNSGEITRPIDRNTLIEEFSLGGIDGEYGPMTAKLPTGELSKTSGHDMISMKHFVTRNFGVLFDKYEMLDPTHPEYKKWEAAYKKHVADTKALREQIMKQPEGTLIYTDITGMGFGVANTDAYDPITLAEAIGDDINSRELTFVVPSIQARGKAQGTARLGQAEGLNSEVEVKMGRVYFIHNGELHDTQATQVKEAEALLISQLFAAMAARKVDERGNLLGAIRQYIYLGKAGDPNAIEVNGDKLTYNGKTIKLKDAAKDEDFIAFLKGKYRQVQKKKLNENNTVSSIESVDIERGRIKYGKKMTYREWLFTETTGLRILGIPMSVRKAGTPKRLDSYLEFSQDLDTRTVAPAAINIQPVQPVVKTPSTPQVTEDQLKQPFRDEAADTVAFASGPGYNVKVGGEYGSVVILGHSAGTSVEDVKAKVRGGVFDDKVLPKTQDFAKMAAEANKVQEPVVETPKVEEKPVNPEPTTRARRTRGESTTAPKKGGKPKIDLGGDVKNRLESMRESNELENFDELKSWFERVFGESFSVVGSKINGNAMGVYTKFGITLWKFAEKGTGYHEAFHKVRAEYLTNDEWTHMVSEYIAKFPGAAAWTEDQIEEAIAEDFRKYVLSGAKEVLGGRARRNTIFRKIYNFLRRLFTGGRTIEDVYEQMYHGTFKNDQKVNRPKRTMYRAVAGLSEEQTKLAVESVNYYFFDILNNSGVTPRQLLIDSPVRTKILGDIYQLIKNELEQKFVELEADLSVTDETLDTFEFILNNFNMPANIVGETQYRDIISAHKAYLKGLGISLDSKVGESTSEIRGVVGEEMENKVADAEADPTKTADFGRNNNDLTPANQINPMDVNSSAIKVLIASLPQKRLVDGRVEAVTNELGIPMLVEFKQVYSKLLQSLAGCSTYEDMYNAMSRMVREDVTYDLLRTRLGRPTQKRTMDQFILQKQFRQDFSKFESRGTITLIDPKTGVYYEEDANANRLVQKIKDRWKNNLRAADNVFIKTDKATGVISLDVTAKNSEGKTLSELSDVEYLRAIGITFTNYTDAELAKLIPSQMVDIIDQTVQRLAKENLPINDLYGREADLMGRMNELAAIEAERSSEIVELSYISAEGKTIYAITLNNYYSLMVNALNNANHWDEVKKRYPGLDTVYTGNSLWLDVLFPKNEEGVRGNKARVKGIAPKLMMNTVSGMKNQSDVESGVAATKMEVGDKIAQEFTSMMHNGQVSLTRAGDKATEYAFQIVWNTPDFKGPYVDAEGNHSHLVVPIDSVQASFDTPEVNKTFMGYFWAELGRIRSFNKGVGKNIQLYKDRAGSWSIFADMFDAELQGKLTKYTMATEEPTAEILEEVKAAYLNYLENYASGKSGSVASYFAANRLGEWSDETKSYTGISKDLTHNLETGKPVRSVSTLIRAFAVNHMIQTIEQHKLLIGDPAFYKDKFKRISGGTGTKKTASVSENDNDWLNKNAIRVDKKKANGRVKVTIFEDHKAVSQDFDQLINTMEKFYQDTKRVKTREELTKIMKPYTEMDEGDAQGWITLDEYREFFLRAGQWDELHEEQYQYEILSKEEQANTPDPGHVFQPIKAQYFGPQVYSQLNAITFHKYSLMPLIPRAVAGTNMETRLADMQANQIGYALFGSGVKVGALLNKEGKLAPFYDGKPGELGPISSITLGKTPIQEIYYEFLGIQLDIAPKTKDKVIFGSQFRKLFLSNMFSKFPVDFKPKDEAGEVITDNQTLENLWKELDEEQRNEASKFYAISSEFLSVEKEIIDRAFFGLVKDLGIEVGEDSNDNMTFKQVDISALVERLKSSAIDRDMADNLIDSIQTVEKDGQVELLYPIDSLVNRPKIENMLFALVNSEVIKQKMNGEGMIQGAFTGWEKKGPRKIGKSADFLKFYQYRGDKGQLTTEMEIMVPATGQYAKLAEQFGGVDGLNAALEEDQVNAGVPSYVPIVDPNLLKLIGYRIPTQGMNSIDVLRIKRFLPQASGSLIILPTEIVAKSGGDFDIDKLNVFRPNIKYDERRKVNEYISFADGSDATAAYKAYASHRSDFEAYPELAATIAGINDKFQATINRSKAQLERGLTAANTAFLEGKTLKLKDVELSEDEVKLMDQYIAEHQVAREEAQMWIDAASTAEEREYLTDQLVALEESYRNNTSQLRRAAKDYLMQGLREQSQAARAHMNKRIKEWEGVKQIEIGLALMDAIRNGVLTTAQLNSVKGLQNRILELAMKSILDPKNFTYLVTPNTTDTLVSAVGDIREQRGEPRKPKLNTPTQELRFDVIMDQFKYFLGGKGGVGIGAVHNTHHTLSQIADVYLNPSYMTSSGTTKGITIPFAHNRTKNKSGANVVSLSGMYDTAGNLISDILSQFINAYVDVAKDPFYKVLNAGTDAASVYFYLVRAGVSLKTAAYFMTQPIVVEFIEAEATNKSLLLSTAGLQKAAKINETDYDAIWNRITKASTKLAEAKKANASEGTLAELEAKLRKTRRELDNIYDSVRGKYAAKLAKGEGQTQQRAVKGDKRIMWIGKSADQTLLNNIKMGSQKSGTWSDAFVKEQLAALDHFIELRKQAGMLTDFMRSLNQDTNLLKNFGSVLGKNILRDKVGKDSFIGLDRRDEVLDKTVVGVFNRTDEITGMYTDMLYTLQEPAQHISRIMRQIAPRSGDFDRVYETLVNDLIGYMTQKFGKTPDGQTLSSLIDTLFSGEGSFARRFAKLNAEGRFNGNLLAKELMLSLNSNINALDNMKLYSRRLTTYDSNALTGAFRELLQSEDEEVAAMGRELVYFGILQSGLHQSPISYTALIPYEEYGNIVAQAIEDSKTGNVDWEHFENAFYWKNWKNSAIVPVDNARNRFANQNRKYIKRFNFQTKEWMFMKMTLNYDKQDEMEDDYYPELVTERDLGFPMKNFGHRLQYYGLGGKNIDDQIKQSPADEASFEAYEEDAANSLTIDDAPDHGNEYDDDNDDYDMPSFGDEAGSLTRERFDPNTGEVLSNDPYANYEEEDPFGLKTPSMSEMQYADSLTTAKEIAEFWLQQPEGELDYKTQIIKDHFKRLKGTSFIQESDKNLMEGTPSIRLNYFSAKDGVQIDILAMQLSEIAGIEIEIQDIVEFILDNPGGPNSVKASNPVKKLLERKYYELTGQNLTQARAEKLAKSEVETPKQRVEVFSGFWTRAQVAADTERVYLFGDNAQDAKDGYVPSSTQAVIRGLPNAIGISTKVNRGTGADSYLGDNHFNWFKKHVDEQIAKAKASGKTIVIPADGIGTGKAMLAQKAPKLFAYLNQELTKLRDELHGNSSGGFNSNGPQSGNGGGGIMNFSALDPMLQQAKDAWNELMRIKQSLVSLGRVDIQCAM